MESTDHRSAVGQLADDLRWLEDHCRREPELAAHAGTLHLASALTRNVIGPFLEGQPAAPLHLVVVGGAGAGKSTVVNFLAGSIVAEANPQAGFTRHPTAFLPAGPAIPWPSFIGFMGTLQRLSSEKPASADEDIYQVRRVPAETDTENPLADFVVWDCPDMTTWASMTYVNRLMEVAALADVVVYVASDERYNDEVPTQFLHLLIKAGKAVVVVLSKVREVDVAVLSEHFRLEILGRLPKLPDGSTPAIPVIAFPHMSQAERGDPLGAVRNTAFSCSIKFSFSTDRTRRRDFAPCRTRRSIQYRERPACSKSPARSRRYEAWRPQSPWERPSSRIGTGTSSSPANSSTA